MGETMPRTITTASQTIDLSGLRAMLEEQRTFRLDQLAQLDAQTGQARTELAGRHLDPLDASADRARTEVSEVLAAAATQALEDIEAALTRMEAGTYGRCERCHEHIPPERLEAVPQARLCMSCQRRAERRR
jgi:RNA polymerase-binding transcription factor